MNLNELAKKYITGEILKKLPKREFGKYMADPAEEIVKEKIEKELGHKDVIAQSLGKVLAETEVRGQLYHERTPEYIINDLITNNTSLTYNDEGESSGLTLEKFNADGKLAATLMHTVVLTKADFQSDIPN